MKNILILLAGATIAVAAGRGGPAPDLAADTIFAGGQIITINNAALSAEALAVKDGKILGVSTKADVLKTMGTATGTRSCSGSHARTGCVDGTAWYRSEAARYVGMHILGCKR